MLVGPWWLLGRSGEGSRDAASMQGHTSSSSSSSSAHTVLHPFALALHGKPSHWSCALHQRGREKLESLDGTSLDGTSLLPPCLSLATLGGGLGVVGSVFF